MENNVQSSETYEETSYKNNQETWLQASPTHPTACLTLIILIRCVTASLACLFPVCGHPPNDTYQCDPYLPANREHDHAGKQAQMRRPRCVCSGAACLRRACLRRAPHTIHASDTRNIARAVPCHRPCRAVPALAVSWISRRSGIFDARSTAQASSAATCTICWPAPWVHVSQAFSTREARRGQAAPLHSRFAGLRRGFTYRRPFRRERHGAGKQRRYIHDFHGAGQQRTMHNVFLIQFVWCIRIIAEISACVFKLVYAH